MRVSYAVSSIVCYLTSERTTPELLRVFLDEIKHLGPVVPRDEVQRGEGAQEGIARLSCRLKRIATQDKKQ